MLFIEQPKRTGVKVSQQWHVGNPMPEITSRVVTFQADGHELEMILAAMRKTNAPLRYGPED
jgi:hypothetical protein